MKNYTIKEYNNIADIISASIDADMLDKVENCAIECVDVDNKEMEIGYAEFERSIKEQGLWGFVDENNTIHVWIGKELSIEKLIHFFAHEIGHNTGSPYKNFLKEELRAESYAEVAELAYKMAVDKLNKL